MPKIVPAELHDPGALEDMRPSRVEARYDVEDTRPLPGLLKPPPEHAHRLVIERNMARLTILGRAAFDRQQTMIEVQRRPTQLQQFATSQAGVHRQNDRRSKVIAKLRSWRERFLVSRSAPGIPGFSNRAHFDITLPKCLLSTPDENHSFMAVENRTL